MVAAATVLCAGTATAAPVAPGFLTSLTPAVSAASAVTFVNSSGVLKNCTSYTKITSTTKSLTGGYYVVDGDITVKNRISVTDDSYIIITDGSTLTAKGGISVNSGCKFNVYTQDNSTGTLYAGTTNGKNATITDGKCAIGGSGANVNIVGGNVYAMGSGGAAGIQGSDIRLYWTNTTDSIYASSYSGKVSLYDTFADMTNNNAYSKVVVNAASLKNSMLTPAYTIDQNTTELNDATYAILDTVSVANRMTVYGDVNIVLGKSGSLRAQKGITVENGNTLTISGSGQLLAGTTNGSNFTADYNSAGIGATGSNRGGSITIKSGNIYANGGTNGAGIGGGSSYVEIDGGKVYAYGGSYGAGIGTNYNSTAADVRILGGNVNAIGGSNAAGIGNGYYSNNTSIYLSWTNNTDTIYASSYSGYLQYLKTLYLSDTGEVAGTNNIKNKTLAPVVSGYIVSFNSNGGSAVNSVRVASGNYLSSVPTPTRNGYVFDGWYLNSGLTNAFDYRTYRITSNITLYAKWANSTHTVSFNSMGGASVNPVYVTHNTYMNSQPLPYRDGFTFVGWYYDTSYSKPFYYRNDKITSDITLYARWSQNAPSYYTISFVSNGGSNVGSMTVKAGDTVAQTDLPFPTRSGYTFVGWYQDSALNMYSTHYTVNSNLTLYAGWSQNSPIYVTVTYNANGGQLVGGASSDTVQISYNDTAYIPSDPTRKGYDFTGWYTDRNCTSYFNFNTRLTSDTVLYSGWTQQRTVTHTVYFETNGGTAISPVTVNDGDTISRRGVPSTSRNGFEFTGWYSDSSCYYGYNFSNPIYSDVTIYAGWQQIQNDHVIYFNTMGGSNIGNITVKDGGVPNLPTPTRNGFSFNGWYTDSNCYYLYNNSPIYSDITLYAGWTQNAPAPAATYGVTLYTYGGNFYSNREISFGGTIGYVESVGDNYIAKFEAGTYVGTPEAPTKMDGSTFGGWFTDPGYTTPFYGTTITENIVLYAKWDMVYTGSVFDNGGLIAAIAGGVVLVGGGIAAAVVVGKKKKNK